MKQPRRLNQNLISLYPALLVMPIIISLTTACSPVEFRSTTSTAASAITPNTTASTNPGDGSEPNSDSPSDPTSGTTPDAPSPTPEPSPAPVASEPKSTTETAPSVCHFTEELPLSFAKDLIMVNDVTGDQNLSADRISQLSNVRGNVTAVARKIDAGILMVNGDLNVLAGEVGIIAGVTKNVCVQTGAFKGVVQNNPGAVELHGLYGPGQLTQLPQINNVGSAHLVNIEVGNVHDIQGDMVIENGGRVIEIANIAGNLTLINTKVAYLHGVPHGVVTLINSEIESYEANTVPTIIEKK